MFCFQDTYVLSGLVFLCCIAIENAVAAVISDEDDQKSFDRYACYIALGIYIVIQGTAIVMAIIKVSAGSVTAANMFTISEWGIQILITIATSQYC